MIDLTNNERDTLITGVKLMIEILNEKMDSEPTREMADMSNTLVNVLYKLKGDSDGKEDIR